tara:strand:+ start:118 stop:288 length:171 start_codon:yes stop_codon:yes gene_type:complete
VTGNASLSDRIRQANLIAQYLKIGQNAKLDFDIKAQHNPISYEKISNPFDDNFYCQ